MSSASPSFIIVPQTHLIYTMTSMWRTECNQVSTDNFHICSEIIFPNSSFEFEFMNGWWRQNKGAVITSAWNDALIWEQCRPFFASFELESYCAFHSTVSSVVSCRTHSRDELPHLRHENLWAMRFILYSEIIFAVCRMSTAKRTQNASSCCRCSAVRLLKSNRFAKTFRQLCALNRDIFVTMSCSNWHRYVSIMGINGFVQARLRPAPRAKPDRRENNKNNSCRLINWLCLGFIFFFIEMKNGLRVKYLLGSLRNQRTAFFGTVESIHQSAPRLPQIRVWCLNLYPFCERLGWAN